MPAMILCRSVLSTGRTAVIRVLTSNIAECCAVWPQTLTDKEYQRLRDAAVAIIREMGVECGGSNVQMGINPVDGAFPAQGDAGCDVFEPVKHRGCTGDFLYRREYLATANRVCT